MHYYQNPMGSTQKVSAEMARAISAFTQARMALKKYSGDSQVIYLNELKKLCLAIEAAEESRLRSQAAAQEVDLVALLVSELQNQLKAFALMRLVTPEQMLESVEKVSRAHGLHTGPGPTRAARLVSELEDIVPIEQEQQYLEGIAVQPLMVLLVEERELVEKLAGLFPHTLDHTLKTLHETNRTLAQLAGIGKEK